MSTYYIADSIDKFTKAFKEVISEKNKIEREKLTFEKEKFEFNKQQLNLNENAFSTNKHYECEVSCNHDWQLYGTSINSSGTTEKYRCSKCGEIKMMNIIGL